MYITSKIFKVCMGYDAQQSLRSKATRRTWKTLQTLRGSFSLRDTCCAAHVTSTQVNHPSHHWSATRNPSLSMVPVGKNGKSTVKDLQPYRGMAYSSDSLKAHCRLKKVELEHIFHPLTVWSGINRASTMICYDVTNAGLSKQQFRPYYSTISGALSQWLIQQNLLPSVRCPGWSQRDCLGSKSLHPPGLPTPHVQKQQDMRREKFMNLLYEDVGHTGFKLTWNAIILPVGLIACEGPKLFHWGTVQISFGGPAIMGEALLLHISKAFQSLQRTALGA